jgi:hypothetical protein
MHKKTIDLKKELDAIPKQYSSSKLFYEAKANLLHNQYKDEECYILTCGPSLTEYSKEFLNDHLKDKLVLTVKTAYDRHDSITDFHFFNCCNLPTISNKPYHYEYGNKTISIASSNFEEGSRWSPVQKYDIFFKIPLVDVSTQMDEFVSVNKNFDEYTLSNRFDRPVGPGIMYETVLFTAFHLGVKKITTVGWDLSQKSITATKDYDHFYPKDSQFWNPGSMMTWEIEATTKASKDLYYWFQKHNIDLQIASTQSDLYENIPRVKLL